MLFKKKKKEELMTFFQRKYLNGQEVHEKVLNITSHQRIKTKNEVSVRRATIKKTHTHTKTHKC